MKLISIILLAGLLSVRADSYFDGTARWSPAATDTNSVQYAVWHPLFTPGHTDYATRSAYLDSLTYTNPAALAAVTLARVYVESTAGHTEQAVGAADAISNPVTRSTTVLSVYLRGNLTNAYADYCQGIINSATNINGDAVVNVACRYARFLKLQGASPAVISDLAKQALAANKLTRAKRFGYNALDLYRYVLPQKYSPPAYKAWLAQVIQNCDVSTNNIDYLTTLKSKYILLP